MVSDRAFILHIHVHVYYSLGKTLSLVSKSRSSVKVQVKCQGHNVQKKKMAVAGGGALVFHKYSLFFALLIMSFLVLEGSDHPSKHRTLRSVLVDSITRINRQKIII